MTFSIGGYGFQGSDPKFEDKIAKLKQSHKSGKQRINDFLEKELGVDPRELRFDVAQANARLKELLDSASAPVADLFGNSMGLKSVRFSTHDYPAATCPNCGASHGYWDAELDPPQSHWYCYDCEQHVGNPQTGGCTVADLTEKAHGGSDWHDLNRIYNAYRDAYPTCYKFTGESNWQGLNLAEPIEPEAPNPDPLSYPTGSVLRIEHTTLAEDGRATSEQRYVRVGWLFNDNEVTILETMTPMQDLSGWTVVEVL